VGGIRKVKRSQLGEKLTNELKHRIKVMWHVSKRDKMETFDENFWSILHSYQRVIVCVWSRWFVGAA